MEPEAHLQALLSARDSSFWAELRAHSRQADSFEQFMRLSVLRRRAVRAGLTEVERPPQLARVALLGGYSLYPLRELVEHALSAEGFDPTLFVGEFDSYSAEILDEASPLYAAAPSVAVILPAGHRCVYRGGLTDPPDKIAAAATALVAELLELCRVCHERGVGEVLLANFAPPPHSDLGAYRTKTLGSEWSFKRRVNLDLALSSPRYVRMCDLDYLATQLGASHAWDDRAWYESKQLGSPPFLLQVAREIAHLVASSRRAAKKVAVLDLDNTLWGGVIGDDGLEGIELGDTSPRGEAYKAFQRYLLALRARGVLLAVCSKNDESRALEPFQSHPEMVLRREHFAAFKANWEPKPDNLRAIARELRLGTDSFVFLDDNPAEIEIVRQLAPEVATVCLDDDPSSFVTKVARSRLFEVTEITEEDSSRSAAYQAEADRENTRASFADMGAFLKSLQMVATVQPFVTADVPRITQLINKTNQFNVTTIRRTEADVLALANSQSHICRSVRIKDRFGDSGLISVFIAEVEAKALSIDTWVMSCRVLNRQVEELVFDELVELAVARGCDTITARYVPTAKNELVRELFSRLGCHLLRERDGVRHYELRPHDYRKHSTAITLDRGMR
jgi:FkbH-like protein